MGKAAGAAPAGGTIFMKTIIAGSRTINDYSLIERSIQSAPWKPTTVVCGDARGVDSLGAEWAEKNGVPVEHFPADWDRYGKRAGFLRNAEMAENAEALILIWDGKSRGSAMMKQLAENKFLKIHEVIV